MKIAIDHELWTPEQVHALSTSILYLDNGLEELVNALMRIPACGPEAALSAIYCVDYFFGVALAALEKGCK